MSLDILFRAGRKTTPIVRQSETAECGLACLAMIASHHGHQTSLGNLRRRFSTTLRGMNMLHIIDIADKLGLTSRALKMPLDALQQIKLPAIIHWDLNHFVVLTKATPKGCTVHDPASGVRRLSKADMSKSFTGVALELEPSATFEKRSNTTPLRIQDLWSSISGLKRGLLQLVILSVFMQLYILLSPFFLQIVVDEVLQKSNTDLLIVLAIGFGGFALFHALSQVLRNFVVVYLGAALSFQIASNLFSHLLALPIDFFEKRHIGDIVSRFNSIDPIKRMLTEGLVGSLIDGLMALTTLLMMLIYSPPLAAVSVAAWTGYFAMRMALYRRMREYEESAITTTAAEQTNFMEAANRVTSLKLFGGEKDRKRLWQNLYAESMHQNVRKEKLKVWFDATAVGLQGIELVIVVSLAISMVLAAEFTIGMLFAFLAYRQSFSTNASALIERIVEFRMVGLHLQRMSDIVHSDTEQDSTDSQPPAGFDIKGAIELKDLRFRYSANDPYVLMGASASIRAGEAVAIVGETGCGKSTLLKLMTTLFQPESGEILIDGLPLARIGAAEFRKHIGVVMQDDGLLSGSIASNIAFFETEFEMDRVIEAARQACIAEDIMKMPMQYESLVGDMGAALSGGQKQRVAIARALYRRPKILFMDEGTSHLDIGMEARINATISNLGITRVIIAHRPETIKMMDRVLLCTDGRLVETDDQVAYGSTVLSLPRQNAAPANAQ